jgi:hypothetical protein
MLKDAVILILILAAIFAVGVFLMMGGPEAKPVLEWFRQVTMDGSLGRWVYMMVGLSLAALLATAVLRIKRGRSGAKSFAFRHGLLYQPPKGWSGHRGRVYGERNGHRVTLALATGSSALEMQVQVPGAPASLTVLRRLALPGVVRAMERVVDKARELSGEIQTGDQAFDQQFAVWAEEATRPAPGSTRIAGAAFPSCCRRRGTPSPVVRSPVRGCSCHARPTLSRRSWSGWSGSPALWRPDGHPVRLLGNATS